MKVEAVERKQHTCLYPMSKGALVGAAAGLISKYAYPLNSEEKSTSEYKSVISDIKAQKKQFGPQIRPLLDEINKKSFKSVAEDAFVKMFDGVKDGEEISFSRKRKAFESVKNHDSDFLNEFKDLCRRARDLAESNAKKCINAYNIVTKYMRPTAIFVIGGALVGALIALVNDVLRTDVKH